MTHSDINIKIEWMEYIQRMQSSKAQDEVLLAIIHYLQDGTDDMFDLSSLEATITWQVLQPMVHRVYVNRQNGNKGGAPKGNKNNLNGRRGNSKEPTQEPTENQPKNQPKTNPHLSNTQQVTEDSRTNLDSKEESFPSSPTPLTTIPRKKNNNIYTVPKFKQMTPTEAKQFLRDKVQECANDYDPNLLTDFFYYWASPIDDSDPDSRLRFQKEKTWATAARLRMWQQISGKTRLNNYEHRTD